MAQRGAVGRWGKAPPGLLDAARVALVLALAACHGSRAAPVTDPGERPAAAPAKGKPTAVASARPDSLTPPEPPILFCRQRVQRNTTRLRCDARWMGAVSGPPKVDSLAVLHELLDLEELALINVSVADYSPLSALPRLKVLNLQDSPIGDLAPLRALSSLEVLNLAATNVTSLEPLRASTRLRELNLDSTDVRDLSPLAGLTRLERLSFPRTEITDLRPLVGLTSLRDLDFQCAPVTDLKPLLGLPNLETLDGYSIRVTEAACEDFERRRPGLRKLVCSRWQTFLGDKPIGCGRLQKPL